MFGHSCCVPDHADLWIDSPGLGAAVWEPCVSVSVSVSEVGGWVEAGEGQWVLFFTTMEF